MKRQQCRYLCLSVWLILFFVVFFPDISQASSADKSMEEEMEAELLKELPLQEIQNVLDENEEGVQISFSDLMRQLIRGEEPDKTAWMRQVVLLFMGNLKEYRTLFVQILILTLAFSFLHYFTDLFENKQVAQMCFYLYFLVLMTLLMKSYLLIHDLLEQVLQRQMDFMNALLPAFCMTMVFASSGTSAAVFYQLSLLVIYLVERVLIRFVIPGIHIYLAFAMLDHMTGQHMISRMNALLKKILIWSMRILLAGVTGMNVIETMIAPSIDNLKKISVTRALGMIPGLGNTAEAVSSLFLGSALVIKNGIGAAALLVLAVICILPLVKILAVNFFYRAAGALVQPFADARVCGCISSVGEAAALLLRAMVTGMLLFMITIAVVVTAIR